MVIPSGAQRSRGISPRLRPKRDASTRSTSLRAGFARHDRPYDGRFPPAGCESSGWVNEKGVDFMATRSGLKLSHILVLVGVLLVLAVVLLPLLVTARARPGPGARHTRCRNNLNQLAKGMATYLAEFGGNWVFYPWPAGRPGCGAVAKPDFGGAEWLAMLYWTKIIPDPSVYLCPSSLDDNEQGKKLGIYGCPDGKRLAPDAVSYAAFGHTSVAVYEREKQGKNPVSNSAIRDEFPPDRPMACDDTQAPINHGDRSGMAVLFFDSHVEYWTHDKVDLEHGVGQGDLVALRN